MARLELDYDRIADVLHISIDPDDDEPSYGHVVDDMIVVLRGTISKVMVGIEVLDAKRHSPEVIRDALAPVIAAERQRIRERMAQLQARMDEIETRTKENDLVPA